MADITKSIQVLTVNHKEQIEEQARHHQEQMKEQTRHHKEQMDEQARQLLTPQSVGQWNQDYYLFLNQSVNTTGVCYYSERSN